MRGALCVCVPARNEADRLPTLLNALNAQTFNNFHVVLSLNNTDDNSRSVISSLLPTITNFRLTVDEVVFPDELAHAGSARERAMSIGAELVDGEGLLLTTDADARPPNDWISANVEAMSKGVDTVGGRIVLDDIEPISSELKKTWSLNSAYWTQVRAIEDEIDPVSWDPPPRHGDHTGASLYLSAALYMNVGGVPKISTGEDRGLVLAVLKKGGRLAHPDRVWTRVSARIVGRAMGGMSHAMASWQDVGRRTSDIEVPHLTHWIERAKWRRALRDRCGSAAVAEMEDTLSPMPMDYSLGQIRK